MGARSGAAQRPRVPRRASWSLVTVTVLAGAVLAAVNPGSRQVLLGLLALGSIGAVIGLSVGFHARHSADVGRFLGGQGPWDD